MDTLLELIRCVRVVETHLSTEFGAIRLPPLHAHLLVILLRDGPSSFRRLEKRLGCPDSTLSSAIRRLEDRCCVRRIRDPGYWTTEHITLTRPGRQLAQWVGDEISAAGWRIDLLAASDDGALMGKLLSATDDAFRDVQGRTAARLRSHRRREDPMLE
jgi:DNA-binding MarR family transcriptional regulator